MSDLEKAAEAFSADARDKRVFLTGAAYQRAIDLPELELLRSVAALSQDFYLTRGSYKELEEALEAWREFQEKP